MRSFLNRPRYCIALLAGLIAGCGTGRHATLVSGPRLRVLGMVQDGGLQNAACRCSNCEKARLDPRSRRFVSSLALIIPESGGRQRVYLVDATPDLREQLELLRDLDRGAGDS